MDSLTFAQHNAVALAMQAATAASGGAALFFMLRRYAVMPQCQAAVVLLAVAAAVSACGAWGLHARWQAGGAYDDAGRFAAASLATPALVAALVLVLNMSARRAWLHGGVLVLASAEMALLAYPGSADADMPARWEALGLCLVPAAVLVFQLYWGLAGPIAAQPRAVRPWVSAARHAIVASWLVHAGLYALPLAGVGTASAFAAAQAGAALVDAGGLLACSLLTYNAAATRSRRWLDRRATARPGPAPSSAAAPI